MSNVTLAFSRINTVRLPHSVTSFALTLCDVVRCARSYSNTFVWCVIHRVYKQFIFPTCVSVCVVSYVCMFMVNRLAVAIAGRGGGASCLCVCVSVCVSEQQADE